LLFSFASINSGIFKNINKRKIRIIFPQILTKHPL